MLQSTSSTIYRDASLFRGAHLIGAIRYCGWLRIIFVHSIELCIRVWACVCVYVCVHVHACTCIYGISVFVSICMIIWTSRNVFPLGIQCILLSIVIQHQSEPVIEQSLTTVMTLLCIILKKALYRYDAGEGEGRSFGIWGRVPKSGEFSLGSKQNRIEGYKGYTKFGILR